MEKDKMKNEKKGNNPNKNKIIKQMDNSQLAQRPENQQSKKMQSRYKITMKRGGRSGNPNRLKNFRRARELFVLENNIHV